MHARMDGCGLGTGSGTGTGTGFVIPFSLDEDDFEEMMRAIDNTKVYEAAVCEAAVCGDMYSCATTHLCVYQRV